MKNLNSIKKEMKKQLDLDMSKVKIIGRKKAKFGFETLKVHFDKKRSTQIINIHLESDWDKNEENGIVLSMSIIGTL